MTASYTPSPGDIVRFKGSRWERLDGKGATGIVIGQWGVDNPDWAEILLLGEVVQWPASQLILVKKCAKGENNG